MKALLAATPAEFHEAIGAKNTAKEAWEMLASFRVGLEQAKKAKAQQLHREFDDLRFRSGESVEDFALRLQSLASQLATFGKPIDDEDVVAKLHRVVPPKYAQLALSIETMLDLSTLTLEGVTGRLRAVEDRTPAPLEKAKGLLLLTEEEWTARMKEKRRTGEGSSRGGDGDKRRGKALADKKKKKKHTDPNACRRYGKVGHWARECSNKKPEKEAHLAREDNDDEHTLLMGEYCALQDGEAEEAEAEQRITPQAIDLVKPRAQVHLDAVGDELEQRWYLDSRASNHITGCKAAFSDLDENKTGSVKFGDGSWVIIRGQGTVVFRCQNSEHRALTGVYYIP
jgi:hypothetical protein